MHKSINSVTIPAMNMMAGNFFLIGLMGAGKTTLGKQLAQYLNFTFYDSDQVICQRTGVTIATIFELEGEVGFRQREANIIDELTQKKQIVLATGGGAILLEQNRHHLQQRGTVIYLHALPDLLYERTRLDRNRPLLQTDQPLEQLQKLYTMRHPIYRQMADVVVDVTHQSAPNTLRRLIHSIYKNVSCKH